MVAALMVAARAAGPQDVEAERRLEEAIHREMVLGDLKGAAEMYRALAQPANPRAVAGRAVFQLAQCLEKEGLSNEALAMYRRVINDYGDAAIARQARAQLAALYDALGPRNLDFREGVPGKVPPGWFAPSLPKDANYLAELRHAGCRSTIGCVVVLVPSNAPHPISHLMQSFSAAPYRGATMRLRAWLRLEAAQPDDRAQMWLSVDRENHRRGFFDNMDNRPVRSAEWTRCEIVGRIDDDAKFIDIGIMSIGSGRVWGDNVSFEVVSNAKN